MTKERGVYLGSGIMFVVRERVRALSSALLELISIGHPINIFNQHRQLNPYVAALKYAGGLYFNSKYFKLLVVMMRLEKTSVGSLRNTLCG